VTVKLPTSGKRPARGRLRQAIRWLVLVAAVALAWPLRRESSTAVFLPALSPFLSVAAALSARAVGTLAALAMPVLVLVTVYPRWFCRHGCPVGLLQEGVERLRPGARQRQVKGPAIGPWLVLLTLGGALAGYPLFLWLDPLAVFNGFLNAWRQPLALATLLTGLGLPLLLLLDLVAPRLWCQRVCPLGATQDSLSWPRRLWPRHVGCEAREGPRPSQEATPPEGGQRGQGPAEGERQCLPLPNRGLWGAAESRRWFLAAFTGAVSGLAVRVVRGSSAPPLRPPAALEEQRFTGVCVRCGNCAQACPSRIIQPDCGAGGLAGFLTPRLRFDRDYCREDCHRCNEVCPSGAIARLSLADKRRRLIGRAVVDLDLCLLAQGRECTACIRKCPYQAISMQSADGGFSNEPRVLADRCNGCGACEAVCPTQPVRAVRVAPLAAPAR
jgi:ferredoxin-type protein NapF